MSDWEGEDRWWENQEGRNSDDYQEEDVGESGLGVYQVQCTELRLCKMSYRIQARSPEDAIKRLKDCDWIYILDSDIDDFVVSPQGYDYSARKVSNDVVTIEREPEDASKDI